MTDVIIIGRGPAGLSAAIYLVRAGLSVKVIAEGDGALGKTDKIDNYFGFADTISGSEILENGIAQAKRLGVEIIEGQVVSIEKIEDFTVKTPTAEYETHTVLLATGKSRQELPIKGFKELRGRGISFCATCDGFFYRGKKIGLIGNGEYALHEYHDLLNFTQDITVFTDGKPLEVEFPEGVKVITDKVSELVGGNIIEAIKTGDTAHKIDGVFVAVGTASAADFALKMGIIMNGSDIDVNADFMTNVEGLYAAGDCIGGFLQVSKAVADGAIASKGIIAYVKAKKN